MLLRHSNFRKRVWLPALAASGLTGVHFHDLRYAGNLLIAHAGAEGTPGPFQQPRGADLPALH